MLMKWQEETKRWIIKVSKTLRRQKWREHVISCGEKDPLVYPHCENYYVYQGEVCPENGKLIVKSSPNKACRKIFGKDDCLSHQYPNTAQKERNKRKERITYSKRERTSTMFVWGVMRKKKFRMMS